MFLRQSKLDFRTCKKMFCMAVVNVRVAFGSNKIQENSFFCPCKLLDSHHQIKKLTKMFSIFVFFCSNFKANNVVVILEKMQSNYLKIL